MNFHDQLPNPKEFGTSKAELERLGAAVRKFLDGYISSELGDSATKFVHAEAIARFQLIPIEPGSIAGLMQSLKYAAANNRLLAGKHYLAWSRGSTAAIARKKAASLGGKAKNKNQTSRKAQGLAMWRTIAADRPRLNKSENSKEVGRRMGVGTETVRDWAKQIPHKAKRG